ncbi:hypothetical protein HAX54_021289 [Datura stramonium]|uniref:Uncharacterized protein n=1 Tax=Datura stramonium TaxID=4076 RepID=A0ABS8USF1_DATST|nr:hypothetical protein [Datura stramonium]
MGTMPIQTSSAISRARTGISFTYYRQDIIQASTERIPLVEERFRSLIPSYIRDSSVAVIVFDVANRQSFLNTSKWIEEKIRPELIRVVDWEPEFVFFEGVLYSLGKIGAEGLDSSGSASEKEEERSKVSGGGAALNTTKHLWAGAVAAAVSRTFVAPLERLCWRITATVLCILMDTIRTVMVAPGGEALGGLIEGRKRLQNMKQGEDLCIRSIGIGTVRNLIYGAIAELVLKLRHTHLKIDSQLGYRFCHQLQ